MISICGEQGTAAELTAKARQAREALAATPEVQTRVSARYAEETPDMEARIEKYRRECWQKILDEVVDEALRGG